MAIVQTYKPKEGVLNKQFQNIVSEHYGKGRTVKSVTFTAANTTVLVDFGFPVVNWSIIGNSTGVSVKKVSVDNRYLHLQASGAGVVDVEAW